MASTRSTRRRQNSRAVAEISPFESPSGSRNEVQSIRGEVLMVLTYQEVSKKDALWSQPLKEVMRMAIALSTQPGGKEPW